MNSTSIRDYFPQHPSAKRAQRDAVLGAAIVTEWAAFPVGQPGLYLAMVANLGVKME